MLITRKKRADVTLPYPTHVSFSIGTAPNGSRADRANVHLFDLLTCSLVDIQRRATKVNFCPYFGKEVGVEEMPGGGEQGGYPSSEGPMV